MDRNIVYPGAIPLDTDILSLNRNTMIALGFLMRAAFGTSYVADGLSCTPTVPASMSVEIGQGSLMQLSVVDTAPYGSLSADTSDPLVKMGMNLTARIFDLQAPTSAGMSVTYLIEACFQETDQDLIVLPYYNASNPSQPFSGPTNSGSPQATLRTQSVQLQLKNGVPSSTGTQLSPVTDPGWVGLYNITISFGQTAITPSNISVLPTAPFIGWKLPVLTPGFGSGVQSFSANGTFFVPAGISQLEVEVWGGGSGSFASVAGAPSGGGSGGGYARKRITAVTPGQAINVTLGVGGNGGATSGTPASAGGTTSFGQYVSATGGSLNYLSSPSSPQLGATPPGNGVNGDINLIGSAGQSSLLYQGGLGGAAPMGGSQNSGTTGVTGTSPGGGASGAGTGANSQTPYNGAAGGPGLVLVRW
jgi:hypothetical protein